MVQKNLLSMFVYWSTYVLPVRLSIACLKSLKAPVLSRCWYSRTTSCAFAKLYVCAILKSKTFKSQFYKSTYNGSMAGPREKTNCNENKTALVFILEASSSFWVWDLLALSSSNLVRLNLILKNKANKFLKRKSDWNSYVATLWKLSIASDPLGRAIWSRSSFASRTVMTSMPLLDEKWHVQSLIIFTFFFHHSQAVLCQFQNHGINCFKLGQILLVEAENLQQYE